MRISPRLCTASLRLRWYRVIVTSLQIGDSIYHSALVASARTQRLSAENESIKESSLETQARAFSESIAQHSHANGSQLNFQGLSLFINLLRNISMVMAALYMFKC